MSAAAHPVTAAMPRSTTDALQRIAAGKQDAAAAWSWLVERVGPAMFRVSERILGSASAADDACQEAFLHLRRGAHRFQAPSSGDAEAAAHAWLLRIAANAAAMWARSERRRSQRERREPVASTIPAAPGDGDAVDALRSALADLPDSQRQPLVLHHLGGQDYAEIGAALGISAGAARVRAHRGLESLRSRLVQVGVLTAVAALFERVAAAEVAVPAGATARWTAILSSSSTPAASSAVIFGGLSIMAKIALLGVAVSAAAIITLSTVPVRAEERQEEQPKPAAEQPKSKPKPKVEAEGAPKKEAHDAMAEGTKGVSDGVIISLEKGRLVLHTTDGNLLFMPHWHGGNPKDGGGLDKAILERLATFKAGDRVHIEWSWSERRRIESIAKAKVEKP